MTFLPAAELGRWFYVYLILPVGSRMIFGWEVHVSGSSDDAVDPLRRTALALEGLLLTSS